MPELAATTWALLMLAAAFVGFAKTALGGAGSLAVVLFAAALPARESTGALLPLLLCGDLVAVAVYRRHGSWAALRRLLPGVLPGLVLGAAFVAVVDDRIMRVTIGLVLLVMSGIHLAQRAQGRPLRETSLRQQRGMSVMVGLVAGFATMTANAGGPVMTLYLIMAGLPMLQMLGTGAWFFLAVNLAKVPFSAGLGLISPASLAMDLALVPVMLTGGAIGVLVVSRMAQRTFELAALALGAVAAGLLVLTA